MNTKFDFKGQAAALLKRISSGTGAPVNRELALAAIEIALRDAYAKGAEGVENARGGANAAQSVPKPARTQAPQVSRSAARPEDSGDCRHQWEEAFLDGRTVGSQCTRCGILEQNSKSACNHYFVKMGAEEICVACRKSRRG